MGTLRIPVLVYGIAIVLMCIAAFNMAEVVPARAFSMLYIGALLFIFSDSIIALDKFKGEQLIIPFPRLLIMVPYLMAQFLIVKGSILAHQARHNTAPQIS